MNYKEKLQDIQFLLNEGWSIAEIEIDGESSFFQTNNFEPPSLSTVQSAPYLHFKGVDITEFMKNSGFNQANPEAYKQRFRSFVEEPHKSIFYQFSDKHNWRYFNK